MRTINVFQLETLLRNVRGSTAVSLIARTDPRMRKGKKPDLNPWFGLVAKVSHVNGLIGFKYQNSVNNQRAREGHGEEFEALPRTWGERIAGTPLVKHNDTFYLEIKCEKSIRSEFRHVDTNEKIDRETLQPWLPKRRESQRQQVEREIILRDYKLTSIVELRMHREIYVLDTEPIVSKKAA